MPVDYIKSTPYRMSFMRDYQLKRNALDRYDRIPNNNARLERVMGDVLQRGVEKIPLDATAKTILWTAGRLQGHRVIN